MSLDLLNNDAVTALVKPPPTTKTLVMTEKRHKAMLKRLTIFRPQAHDAVYYLYEIMGCNGI